VSRGPLPWSPLPFFVEFVGLVLTFRGDIKHTCVVGLIIAAINVRASFNCRLRRKIPKRGQRPGGSTQADRRPWLSLVVGSGCSLFYYLLYFLHVAARYCRMVVTGRRVGQPYSRHHRLLPLPMRGVRRVTVRGKTAAAAKATAAVAVEKVAIKAVPGRMKDQERRRRRP